MQTVRIIGGEWRSRQISFPDISGLRPTQDRIRETLFNWLMPFIVGAKCLDLFAGSGALGFEALSRGAQFTCFVDSHPQAIAALRVNAEKLAIEPNRLAILRGLVPEKQLLLPEAPFDIIFLDPPFHQNLLPPSVRWLTRLALLMPGALIYMEMEKEEHFILPEGWEIFRKQETASLIYQLVRASDDSG